MQNMTLIALKLNNYNHTVFTILNVIKYKIVAVVFLIRFSRYVNIYIRVCSNVLFRTTQFKKFNDIFLYSNSLKKINKNAVIFYLFSIKSSSKKNIAIASAKKKKSNLFRKYNTYKRSLLYKAQKAIKNEHFRNTNFRKALLTPHMLRNINKTALNQQQQPISMLEINADRKKRNRTGYFTYANLSFYKKLARAYPRVSFSKFFQKKRALYKLNRHFNKRFYSNRLMLRDMYLYKNSRQFSITRFVEQFKTHKKCNVYKQLQMTLLMVLISAQFFVFKDDCVLFLKKYGVFVNGKLCTNPYRVIIKGDIIQLPITSSIYSYFFKLKRVNFFYLKKFSKKLRKMYLSKKYRFRTRSYYTPKCVHKVAFIGNDIPSYLEVDFTILTIMVIYNCNTAYDINSNIADYTLLYLHRTYNWRSLA